MIKKKKKGKTDEVILPMQDKLVLLTYSKSGRGAGGRAERMDDAVSFEYV